MGVMFWSRIRARHAQVTTLNPAVRRGNLLILKYDEDPLVRRSTGSPREGRPEPAQPLDLSLRMTRSCCLKLVRETGMQHVSRPCRRTWMTRKPRKRRYYILQIHYILAFVCRCLFAQAISAQHLQYVRYGPC